MVLSAIANLPTEILLLILQHLSTDDYDILTVGKLCRRLNAVAIPYLLIKKGLSNPETSSVLNLQDHEEYDNTLVALSLNFSLTKIKHLVFVLDTSSTRTIHRIHHLISRLSSITSLRLFLRSVGETWSLQSEFVVEFIDAFVSLLQTVLLKSCNTLQIVHSNPFPIETNHVFQVMHRRTPFLLWNIAKLAKALSGCLQRGPPVIDELQGHRWRYQERSISASSRASAPPLLRWNQSSLSILDINTDFLLVPPFLIWTVGLLERSKITSLSLSLPRNVTLEEFSHFLFPKITKVLPLLQEIKLAFFRDEFLPTVVENLHRLQSLRKITIALTSFGDLPSASLAPPMRLLNLVAFTGSLQQAAYLFACPISCPNLHFLNIVVDFYFRESCDHTGANKLFSILRRRLLELHMNPCISVCLVNMDPPSLAPTSRILDEDNVTESLLIVSRLTLTLPAFCLDKTEVEHQAIYALAWLNAFRGVQSLTLLARTLDSDNLAREARDLALRTSIFAQWPNLKSFDVIDLLSDEYHAHWSNFHDDFARGIDGIPSITTLKNKTESPCICSDF